MTTQRVPLPDGASTHIEWFGSAGADKGLVAFLPALGVSVEYYREFNRAWAQRGYRVAAIEMRGMKHSSVKDVRRENFGYREILRHDLPALVAALQCEAGAVPFFLAGHSLGAHFALLHAARHRRGIAGVAVIAGGSNYYGALPTGTARLKRHLAVRTVRLINAGLGYFPGHKLGFGGRQPHDMIADWAHEALTGRYKVRADATDYDDSLASLDLPVILISLSGDRLLPRSSADFLAAKMPKARLTQIELQAEEHGVEAYPHFRWVRRPAPILDRIEHWAGECRCAVGRRGAD